MAQQKLPDIPNPRTTIYDNLLGVDFRADQTEVERRRSPDMVNMISDLGGNPIKRDGYRKVGAAYAGLVTANGEAYGVRAELGGIVVVPVSIGSVEALIQEDTARAITVSSDYGFGAIKSVFGYQQYIFILCSNGAAKVDVTKYANGGAGACEVTGLTAKMMSANGIGSSAPACDAIIPLSIIGLQPDATGTNGTVLYGKNLMSIYQTYCYAGDGTSTVYKIPLYSKMGAWVKVEVMDANANWSTLVQGTDYTIGTASNVTAASLDGTTTQSFSVCDAQITFTTAPSSPTSSLAGEDNVRITVAPFNMADTVNIGGSDVTKGFYNENLVKLFKSNAHMFYDSRLFFGVGEKTFYSEVGNAFLIPDNNWFDVDNEIVCYQKMSNNLAVITKDTGKNTIFLASQIESSLLGDMMTSTFQVKTSNAGVGAITGEVGGVLNDEPMFLSSTGLYGLLTNWTSEKYAVNRSGRINRRLCKENNLSSAVGIVFNGYYYLAINAQMYILDSRHKDNTRSGDTSYECYYFNGMPSVTEMFVVDNKMFFADENYTYTWNSDLPEALKYYDELVLDENGEFVSGIPVSAYWSSKFDDDDCPQLLKTLKKKGTMVILTPHRHTGCYVTLIKNGDEYQQLGYTNTAIFSFEEVNFGYDDNGDPQFIFASNTVAYDRFTKKKIKKYKRLQMIVGNDRPEPFALTKVVKTYEIGNYAKR
jgi:hypothetical protein